MVETPIVFLRLHNYVKFFLVNCAEMDLFDFDYGLIYHAPRYLLPHIVYYNNKTIDDIP